MKEKIMSEKLKQKTEKWWKRLDKKIRAGQMTNIQICDATEGQYEHPDWWEHGCICNLCKSYGD